MYQADISINDWQCTLFQMVCIFYMWLCSILNYFSRSESKLFKLQRHCINVLHVIYFREITFSYDPNNTWLYCLSWKLATGVLRTFHYNVIPVCEIPKHPLTIRWELPQLYIFNVKARCNRSDSCKLCCSSINLYPGVMCGIILFLSLALRQHFLRLFFWGCFLYFQYTVVFHHVSLVLL